MSTRRMLFIVACLLLMLSSSVQCANQVSWSYTLTDQGDGVYTYLFNFSNLGPAKDAIFKIQFSEAVSSKWDTISWDLPTGWDSSMSGRKIDFITGNGDMSGNTNGGIFRIFGQTGAPAPSPGWTSRSFSWTFENNGGPTPTQNYFGADDVVIHTQMLNDNWRNVGNTYPVNPVPEPSALAALGLSSLSLVGLIIRKRRR